ncbi:MAG TPA: ACP phosphodiesterase [Cyclobacteriaceae bacterium]|nr:ACP phosphodiesterase [Cyclobacteriaceae bacterium]
MNFLAHLYLSGDDDSVMVGNFIGDFVKGRNLSERYDTSIVRGIELHRSIDAFTDSHSIVMQSKDKLREKYHHYSAVIVDMYYDHFLARNWSTFHALSLKEYTLVAYSTIKKYEDILPDAVRHMLTYMSRDNWLLAYAKLEGIHRALSGMARRTPFQSRMEEAVVDLEKHYDVFEKEFLEFFPELKAHATGFLNS